MKVMVLGIRGIPNVQGGVETHAEQLYRRLAALGCEVDVIVRSPFVPRGSDSYGPIRLRRIWAPKSAGLEALLHSVLGVLYAAFKRPDILHIHAIGPAIVAPIGRLLGLRIVVTHHGPDYDRDKWGKFARWVLRTGERLGMRYASARIAISKVIAELIRAKHHRDAELIPNGVVVMPLCERQDLLTHYGLEPRRYFLMVSRMVPEKRQLDLIHAFATARPSGWKLVLAGGLGTDAYSQEVKAAAHEHSVVTTGFLSGVPLQQIYSHAGAFVLPSSHEGLPIALLEALSYGLPAVCSAIPANLEVGLPQECYFPLGDTAALAARLLSVAQTPDIAAQREARRVWVGQRYDWDHIAQRTLEVYESIML
jgi:glycosyltransferase involved in cell wall biosynthesis